MYATFNRRVQDDVNEILAYYELKSGRVLADEFYEELNNKVRSALVNPTINPIYAKTYRKATLKRFPYHFLYRQNTTGIRVYVVRHNKRHLRTGMSRR